MSELNLQTTPRNTRASAHEYEVSARRSQATQPRLNSTSCSALQRSALGGSCAQRLQRASRHMSKCAVEVEETDELTPCRAQLRSMSFGSRRFVS